MLICTDAPPRFVANRWVFAPRVIHAHKHARVDIDDHFEVALVELRLLKLPVSTLLIDYPPHDRFDTRGRRLP